MSYALVSDVATSLGRLASDLTAAETAQITSWLTRVEARIRRRVPTLDALALDAGYVEVLKGIEVDVVLRRFLNPEGKTSESIDDYTYRRNDAHAAADLWLTDAEWAELTPTVRRGAFSIRPQLSS